MFTPTLLHYNRWICNRQLQEIQHFLNQLLFTIKTPLSALPSVLTLYGLLEMLFTICRLTSLAMVPMIWQPLVHLQATFLAIFESGNIDFKSGERWSSVLNGRLCAMTNFVSIHSASITSVLFCSGLKPKSYRVALPFRFSQIFVMFTVSFFVIMPAMSHRKVRSTNRTICIQLRHCWCTYSLKFLWICVDEHLFSWFWCFGWCGGHHFYV